MPPKKVAEAPSADAELGTLKEKIAQLQADVDAANQNSLEQVVTIRLSPPPLSLPLSHSLPPPHYFYIYFYPEPPAYYSVFRIS